VSAKYSANVTGRHAYRIGILSYIKGGGYIFTALLEKKAVALPPSYQHKIIRAYLYSLLIGIKIIAASPEKINKSVPSASLGIKIKSALFLLASYYIYFFYPRIL
jgi:hypothetical protein